MYIGFWPIPKNDALYFSEILQNLQILQVVLLISSFNWDKEVGKS